jgi:hypothetical protein
VKRRERKSRTGAEQENSKDNGPKHDYRFRTRLIDRALAEGKEVVVCEEHYTSKCCGRCGMLNDVGGRIEAVHMQTDRQTDKMTKLRKVQFGIFGPDEIVSLCFAVF